jgi:hypothetical protein
MASFESSDNETYSAARKQDDQWVACITPTDFFIDNKGSLTTIKCMLIQQISLQRLRRTICTLASQSSNAEFSRATFLVKREKEIMDVVS